MNLLTGTAPVLYFSSQFRKVKLQDPKSKRGRERTKKKSDFWVLTHECFDPDVHPDYCRCGYYWGKDPSTVRNLSGTGWYLIRTPDTNIFDLRKEQGSFKLLDDISLRPILSMYNSTFICDLNSPLKLVSKQINRGFVEDF